MQRPPWTRRDFLAAGAALAAGGCAAWGGSPDILDAHVHFYDPTRPEGVPWPPKDDRVLYRPVLPPEFEALARPLGVTGAVAVEASPWAADNLWLLDLAERHPFILGVVVNLPVGRPEFGAAFEGCRPRGRFKGVRIRGEAMKAALAGGAAREHMLELEAQGLAVDLLIRPEDMPDAARFGDRFRNLRVVIDHCGNVPITPPPHPRPWVSGLAACHYTPNIFMKVSGLVEGTGRGDGTAPRELGGYRETLDTLWRVFGPKRLLWSSNWPVSLLFADYATVLRLVREFAASLEASGAHDLFHRTAVKAYRLE